MNMKTVTMIIPITSVTRQNALIDPKHFIKKMGKPVKIRKQKNHGSPLVLFINLVCELSSLHMASTQPVNFEK